MKTFLANLKQAVRNHETVSMGGGEFDRGELVAVLGAVDQLQNSAALALEALEWSWGGEPMGTKEHEAMRALRAAIRKAAE